MIHQYSLADYQLTVGFPYAVAQELNLRDPETGNILTNFTIGGPGEEGEGSFVGQIAVKRNTNLFTTTGDATGSWVHDKNLDKTGTISVDITQISDQIVQLIHLCKIYESVQTNMPGLTLTIASVNANANTSMVEGIDSYINKLPDVTFAQTAGRLTWEFTCGQIIYNYSR